MSGRLRASRRASDAVDLGFTHVTCVRMRNGTAPARFEVDGIVHRRPVTRALSPRLAARLVARGVPLVVHHDVAEGQAC